MLRFIRNMTPLIVILAINLNCGYSAIKFAGDAWQSDSWACMHGNSQLSKYVSYAALLGYLVDCSYLAIPYLLFFPIFSRQNRIRLGAIVGIYALGCIPLATQFAWVSDRSPACKFDFQIGDTKIKQYGITGSIAEIAELGFWTMVPRECSGPERLANLNDKTLLLQILAKPHNENGVLIYDDKSKRFLNYVAQGDTLVVADLPGWKSAYCILP
jgi:hypothetical protein